MADNFIGHDQHGQAVFLAQVKGFNSMIKHFLRRHGCKSYDLIVAVRAPAGLHHIALGAKGGKAGGGARALHIHDNAGCFGADAQPDIFHHEAETRARCCGHAFPACPGGAKN